MKKADLVFWKLSLFAKKCFNFTTPVHGFVLILLISIVFACPQAGVLAIMRGSGRGEDAGEEEAVKSLVEVSPKLVYLYFLCAHVKPRTFNLSLKLIINCSFSNITSIVQILFIIHELLKS